MRINSDANFWLPFDVLLLSFVSVDEWSPIKLGGTTVVWILALSIYISLWIEQRRYRIKTFSGVYIFVGIYLLWAIFCIVRGCFVASNYWEYKKLVSTSFMLLMPYCVYSFGNPNLLCKVIKTYFVFALIAFGLWFYWMIGFSQFFLGPVYMMTCFIPTIKNSKWKFILLVLVIALLINDPIAQRAQSIKALVALLLMFAYIFRRIYPVRLLNITFWILLVLPIILITLGLSGIYNVFSDTNDIYSDRYVHHSSKGYEDTDIADDTRTFIYYETITSALNNNYVLLGRTPARGNDTEHFWDDIETQKKKHFVYNLKYERQLNEVCFPNFFTWIGLIGMTLYCLIYIVAAYMGFYHSKSLHVKLMALFVAFNFTFGWIENCTHFDIENFMYWFMISICLSQTFRNMTDNDMIMWVNRIFQ